MKRINHASLFSGIGGWDLAAKWMGWNNVFQCEIDPFCREVLKYHFPKTVLYEDIRRTDFKEYRGKIDVLTWSTPCQPFSLSGKRKGADDDRHLWPEALRVIRETKPRWTIGENVNGITSMVQPIGENDVERIEIETGQGMEMGEIRHRFLLQSICEDLEAEGYDVQPVVIPACGVGAPHQRYRVWIIASDSSDARAEGLREGRENEIHELESTSHSNGTRGFQLGERRNIRDKEQYDPGKEPERHKQSSRFGGGGEAYVISDNKGELMEDPMRTREGGTGFTDGYSKNPWLEFPTQPPVCGRDDGISLRLDDLTISGPKWRKETIKAYGNAIVPQIAYEIFKNIQGVEGNYGR